MIQNDVFYPSLLIFVAWMLRNITRSLDDDESSGSSPHQIPFKHPAYFLVSLLRSSSSSRDHMEEKKINKQKQKIPHVQISAETMAVKSQVSLQTPRGKKGAPEVYSVISGLSSRVWKRGETMETRMDQRTERDSREERLPPAICQVKRHALVRLRRNGVSQ